MNENTEAPCRILVIDDEPLMLSLIERVLLSEGYQVSLAPDGISGLQLVSETHPDLILLDIMMPGLNGLTVLKRIREVSDAPVIMVTAIRDGATLQETINNGADDYIKKPFRPEEMVARVKAKLRRT